jgi:hypothetical protein
MFAAEQQLEAAQGVQDTPFVTMKLTINEQHEIIVEAFQVLRVCVCFVPPFIWNSFCSLYGDCCEQIGFHVCGHCTELCFCVALCLMCHCLSTCATHCVCAFSHVVTVFRTPAWSHPVDESAVLGDEEEGALTLQHMHLIVFT